MDVREVKPYPLTFEPVFKEKVWGGRRLAEDLAKQLPSGRAVGESWELVDLRGDQSVVAAGPAAGTEIHDLLQLWGSALMGRVGLDGGRFPLLVKFLDACQTLSVQVHPDEEMAARLGGRPKSEAWYILEVQPGGVIYLGLKPGATRQDLSRAVERDRVEDLLVPVAVKPGDLVPVPPGTVHAIGAGVLLAEVQQPSDTTYRIYDWGRMGLRGKPRQLHIDEALRSIHFNPTDPPRIMRRGTVDVGLFRFTLAHLGAGEALRLCPSEQDNPGPVVLVGLLGEAEAEAGGRRVGVGRGEVVLLPAGCPPVEVAARSSYRYLKVTFP